MKLKIHSKGNGNNYSKEEIVHTDIEIADPKLYQLEIVYGVLGHMQVLSTFFLSSAYNGYECKVSKFQSHWPFRVHQQFLKVIASKRNIVILTDVLAWGGFGIVAGLMKCCYRVVATTIERKIIQIRGFATKCALWQLLYFCLLQRWSFNVKKLGDITEMTFSGRYVIMLMSIFSIFNGLIYYEFFFSSI